MVLINKDIKSLKFIDKKINQQDFIYEAKTACLVGYKILKYKNIDTIAICLPFVYKLNFLNGNTINFEALAKSLYKTNNKPPLQTLIDIDNSHFIDIINLFETECFIRGIPVGEQENKYYNVAERNQIIAIELERVYPSL